VAAVALVGIIAAAVLVATRVIDLPPALPAAPVAAPIERCRQAARQGEWIEAGWPAGPVRIDGHISHDEEWVAADCLRLVLGEPVWEGEEQAGGKAIQATWWVQNDEDWLYMLVRVPTRDLKDRPEVEGYGVSISHFWPDPFEEFWEFSDTGGMDQAGDFWDGHGWDNQNWFADEAASPPGEIDGEAAVRETDQYIWFEFKKALHSGDRLDWEWWPGQVVGDGGPDDGPVLLGAWGRAEWTWFESYVVIHLAGG
jgi:hypothetical protein